MRNKSKHTLNHDQFFRKSMSIPEVAQEVIEMHLPEELLNKIYLSSLQGPAAQR
jgi:hypothetical protein